LDLFVGIKFVENSAHDSGFITKIRFGHVFFIWTINTFAWAGIWFGKDSDGSDTRKGADFAFFKQAFQIGVFCNLVRFE